MRTAWIGKLLQIRLVKRDLKRRSEAVRAISCLSEIPPSFGRGPDVTVVMAIAACAEEERSQLARLPAAGIMNSFIGISKAQTTNLAVVAPGIAGALLATAIGLVAAIPAVIFYNQLARSITEYRAELADFGASLERLVSRDLDSRDAAGLSVGSSPVNAGTGRHNPGVTA